MPYYGQGDYYMAGDPGFLSALGGFAKRAVATGIGFATGGLSGAVAANLPGRQVMRERGLGAVTLGTGPSLPMIPMRGEASKTTSYALEVSGLGADVAGIPPRGYHLNKSGYFLKSGEWVAPRSRYVRNRSRNVANGRALRRAVSRASAFAGMVKRTRKSLHAIAKV